MIKDLNLDASLFFESIFDSSPDAQLIIDKRYTILRVNRKFCTKTNINKKQAEEGHLDKIIGQALFRKILRPKIDTCFHTWTSINFSTRLEVSGQTVGLNLVLTPIHSNLPPFDSILITAKELSDKIFIKDDPALLPGMVAGETNANGSGSTGLSANASKLKETEANISSLIEDDRTLIWSVDNDYKLTFFNSNFSKLAYEHYGIHLRTGLPIGECVDKKTKAYWKEHYERAFSGKKLKLNYVHNLPEGKLHTELCLNPIIKDNKVIGVNAFGIDVTELKKQERVLLNLNTSLRQEIEVRKKIEKDLKFKNNELDTFIYKASHDLRGPIASLVGLYNAAKIEIRDSKAHEYLDYIHKTSQRMDQVLKALINLSEIKDRQINLSVANIQMLVSDILNVLESRHKGTPVKFEVSVPKGLEFDTDEGLLVVMLKNLIENGIKYAGNKGTTVIKIKAFIKNQELTLLVADNGMGMDPMIQDKVFNMFYKGNNLSNGSGLGLYMVKSAVNKLGGNVDLKSSLGEGTKFTIVLPCLSKEM